MGDRITKSPNIRFVGFNDDWELHKIGEQADIVRGASPRPIQDPKWFDIESEVGWLRISDVTEQDGRIYHLDQRISKLGQQKTRVLNEPHLLLSIAATVGKPVVNYVKTGVHDGFLIFLNPKFDCEFMFQWLEMFRPMWQRYGQPGSQVNLNSDLVKNQEIVLPSTGEQVKVGKLLSQFDNLITLHQRKLDLLKVTKKSMLQKMFPKDGSNVPEIRFAGFAYAWEQRKLGEYCDMYNGDRGINYPNEKDMVSDGIPFINAGDLQNGRVNLNTSNKITREKYNQLGGAKLEHGDIVYCLRGTLGKNAFIDNFREGTVASSLVAIRPHNIDGKYLFHILNSDIELRQRIICDEGAAQPNLSAKNLSGFNIPIPRMEEQIKISRYFDNIDNLITLHQRELDLLKDLKKSMLQQMFI